MDNFAKTAASIAQKIKLHADVLVFSPVCSCEDALFEKICLVVGGRILCVLPTTPLLPYRKSLYGGNRFFVGKHITKEENKENLKQIKANTHCVVFTSVTDLQQDGFDTFLNELHFSVLMILQAENISPILHNFDKRLRTIAELRASLQQPLPICAFCATDQSAVLRDITNNFALKTPTRFYPGCKKIHVKLYSQQSNPSFTAFENKARLDNIKRALVLCNSRQTAEDAYRYFRFFGYQCRLSHAGLNFEQREHAVSQFIEGKADFLFTTSFKQSAFCNNAFTTVFLGIPPDVYSLYTIADPQENIYCFYTKDDEKEGIYRIEEDNEIKSAYTNLPPYNLKQERFLLHENILQDIHNGITPYESLHKRYDHIYFDTQEV